MATIDRETGLPILQPQEVDLAPAITIALNDQLIAAAREQNKIANAKQKCDVLVVHNLKEVIFMGSFEEFYERLAGTVEPAASPVLGQPADAAGLIHPDSDKGGNA